MAPKGKGQAKAKAGKLQQQQKKEDADHIEQPDEGGATSYMLYGICIISWIMCVFVAHLYMVVFNIFQNIVFSM